MKKYLVIGNPINHSLSPELHNYWIKQNSIDAIYVKKKINTKELANIILDVKQQIISGINVEGRATASVLINALPIPSLNNTSL